MSKTSNLIFPQSPLATLIIDRNSLKISETNQAAESLFRHEPEHFRDAHLQTVCAGGEFPRLADALERGPRSQLLSLKMLRAQNKTFHAEVTAFQLDDTGMDGTWVLFIRDITDLKAAASKLHESEERYRGLASVAFDGVAVHFGGILLQTTRSFDSLFGYAEGDAAGRSIDDMVIEDQRGYFKRELDQGNVVELECLREDGRHIHIEASTRPCAFLGEPAYVTAVRDISVRKMDQLATRHQADFDSLTGLPNRMLFYDRLCVAVDQSARDGRLLAVLFLDLDRFKNVNDALGHNVGDLLLFEVAVRLTDCLGAGDTACRLGGDEFTVLLRELADEQEAILMAEKIGAAINMPFLIHKRSISIGISIGISIYPTHAKQADGLIAASDAAMYHAKDNGRNHCKVFGPDTPGNSEKLELEASLRKAIEDKEFVVYYQPKVDLATGKPMGAEALVRWQHPERGLVMPDDFIPKAEETHLILALGEYVLNAAFLQAKRWEEAGIKIAINLSPIQFSDPLLIKIVDAAAALSQAKPASIEFEITETVAMKNPGHTLSILKCLVSRGYSISMDDFGKGYSSLNYLKQFPISMIKIDIAFIRDILKEPKDAAIVRAIILLGHNLHMKVLAEGVEEERQADFLRDLGCDIVQGYLYSRPIPAEGFEKLYCLESEGFDRRQA